MVDGVYLPEQIVALTAQHDKLFAERQAIVVEADPEQRTFLQDGGAGSGSILKLQVDVYEHPDGEELLRVAPGRYDFTSGMGSGCFGDSSFHEPPLVAALMARLLKERYSHYAGGLPSVSASSDGPWHRDTYDLFGDFGNVDCKLPPFYFNILVPLVDLFKGERWR